MHGHRQWVHLLGSTLKQDGRWGQGTSMGETKLGFHRLLVQDFFWGEGLPMGVITELT